MLECDRCGDNYEFTPSLVQGKVSQYLMCPLCSYDLKQHIDRFCNPDAAVDTYERTCGHIFSHIIRTRH